jgi:hypothetical protein
MSRSLGKPASQPSMKGKRVMDKTQVLTERRLRMERDGIEGAREVALQIGIPQWSKGGDDAVCAIAIVGLDEKMPPVRGRDFFDVLVKAARTMKLYCKTPPKGVRLFYIGEPPYDREPYDGEPIQEDCEAERRRTEALHRKDWPVLVERKILMQRDGSDERNEVVLQIGHPYWMVEGETAACPIAMKGDDVDEVEHREGRDLFEALSSAVGYINERFEGPQCGRFYFWPDGRPYGGDYDYLLPRHDERDPRGISGNWEVLAERTLLMERDGETKRRQITIKIGRPYWEEDGEMASCPIDIVGLCKDMRPLHGEDFYMVLIFALDFFNLNFMNPDMGMRFFWPDGTPYEGEPLDREPGT